VIDKNTVMIIGENNLFFCAIRRNFRADCFKEFYNEIVLIKTCFLIFFIPPWLRNLGGLIARSNNG